MRSIFFGTPALALPALRALSEVSELVGVVCQPDRPAGRGLSLAEPPVKQAAQQLGAEIYQPVKVKTGELYDWLAARRPDVAIVFAYGRILPPAVLATPRRGCLNLHASLLPKYRGAAPINWAIVNGEDETGISLMQMDEGLDTGPVYVARRIPIAAQETAGELSERLAELAALVVRQDLLAAVAGELPSVPQDSSRASWAPPITREHARLDWAQDPTRIVNLVRGMSPRPGAHTRVRGKNLRILCVRVASEAFARPPGTVQVRDRARALVKAGAGSVELVSAQLEGKKALSAAELVNGRVLRDGDLLG